MIRYLNKTYQYGEACHIEIACNSEDTKPTTGIATGSIALEADTGDLYVFDEETSAWVKQN